MTQPITFVHFTSESGDDYYYAFDGHLTDEEIEAKIVEKFSDWEDPDCISAAGVLYWPKEEVKGP